MSHTLLNRWFSVKSTVVRIAVVLLVSGGGAGGATASEPVNGARSLSDTRSPHSSTSEIFSNGFEQGNTRGWSSSLGGGPVVPVEVCDPPISAQNTSGATTVGTGNPAGCTEAALRSAVAANNGAIRFDCGAAPHTITLSSQLSIDNDLVLDGAGLITLSGGGATRIIDFRPPWGQHRTLTVQNITFRDGSTAHLPGTTTDNGGAAIYRGSYGTLNVIDSFFFDNVGPVVGQDVAGARSTPSATPPRRSWAACS